MDTLQFGDGGMWFESSKEWADDRSVLYGGTSWLVPLLRSEVPFEYPEGLVFLWDRKFGIAMATSLAAAWQPERAVAHELSRAALFGGPDYDDGYCYRKATAGREVHGPYPTAKELRESGALDKDAVVSYEKVQDGRYHCVYGSEGAPFEVLPDWAVVGGLRSAVEYLAWGVAAGPSVVAAGHWAFQRCCVAGAAVVNLCASYDENSNVAGPGQWSDAEWFACKRLEGGLVLHMGLVSVRNVPVGARVRVAVPGGAYKLYWHEMVDGVPVTRTGCGNRGSASFVKQGDLASVYVYAVSDHVIDGAQEHPVRSTGLGDLGCFCSSCMSEQGVSCFAQCMPVEVRCGCRAHSWAVFRRHAMTDAVRGLRVSSVGRGLWHIGRSGPYSLYEVLQLLGEVEARGDDHGAIYGQYIHLWDLVGSTSLLATQLSRDDSIAAGLSAEQLDEIGARLAGSPPSVLGSSDKVHLKCLQVLGDCLLSMVLAEMVLEKGLTAQTYQETRSLKTSNPYLRDLFVRSEYAHSFVGGVKDLPSKTGGGAVEALVAVVYRAGGMPAVKTFLVRVGFVDD